MKNTVSQMDRVKIVIVGDGGVGKTSLLMRHFSELPPLGYAPNVCDTIYANFSLENHMKFGLEVYDTAGAEDSPQIIQLIFPGTECFLLCYSVILRESVENLLSYWIPCIKLTSAHDAPIVVCGTKADLSQVYQDSYVSIEDVHGIIGSNYEIFEVSTFDEAAISTTEGQIAKTIEACVKNAIQYRGMNAIKSPVKCFLC